MKIQEIYSCCECKHIEIYPNGNYCGHPSQVKELNDIDIPDWCPLPNSPPIERIPMAPKHDKRYKNDFNLVRNAKSSDLL